MPDRPVAANHVALRLLVVIYPYVQPRPDAGKKLTMRPDTGKKLTAGP
jgi:hypothetical protein